MGSNVSLSKNRLLFFFFAKTNTNRLTCCLCKWPANTILKCIVEILDSLTLNKHRWFNIGNDCVSYNARIAFDSVCYYAFLARQYAIIVMYRSHYMKFLSILFLCLVT